MANGTLAIHAERHDEAAGKHHSEFRYGSFTRHVALPAAADESGIQASYDSGILEVSVGLKTKGEGKDARAYFPAA